MCSWGEAYVLGPNINAPMDPEAIAPAAAAISRAKNGVATASERERTLITALEKRYSADPRADRSALNQAYADAMADAAARFPGDVEITTLYADALMNLLPWDYWEADGRTLKPPVARLVPTQRGRAGQGSATSLCHSPHIHPCRRSLGRAGAGGSYADWLGPLMRGAGHMVHMPSHIYFRLGRFQDSIAANKNAVAADENTWRRSLLTAPIRIPTTRTTSISLSSRPAWSETAHGSRGGGKAAADHVGRGRLEIPGTGDQGRALFRPCAVPPGGDDAEHPDPGEQFPYVRAMWHYVRGVAHAARGDAKAARQEVVAIRIRTGRISRR